MSREQDQINFIAPYPLEICREQLLGLKRPWKLFSNHQRRVNIKPINDNAYHFHLYDNIGRNLSVVANGVITA